MPRKEFIDDLQAAQASRDIPHISNLIAGTEDGLIQFDINRADSLIPLKVESLITGTVDPLVEHHPSSSVPPLSPEMSSGAKGNLYLDQ